MRAEGPDGSPGGEKGVPKAAQAMLVDDTGDPHGRIGGGVGAEDRSGGQPPGQAASGEEKVTLGAARQAVEKGGAADHEQQEGHSPENVEIGEVGHGAPEGWGFATRASYHPVGGWARVGTTNVERFGLFLASLDNSHYSEAEIAVGGFIGNIPNPEIFASMKEQT